MTYLLFNPLSNNNSGLELKEIAKKELLESYSDLKEIDVTNLDVDSFVEKLKDEDDLILLGGDGTLNHFANHVYSRNLNNKMYLYRAGTGNDFLRDVTTEKEKLFLLNPYLKKLPKVTINGKETRYVNGIGYGIDGMVCVVSDAMKAKGKKKINYTSIAIKLLLTKYHCPDAVVIVDGKETHYKKVWLASAMNGRFYGGGMMMAPSQDRLSNELSCCVVHGSGRLRTLMLFPKIFTGEHIKYNKYVTIQKAKRIEVRFSSPMALQIDGEVVENVTSYVAEVD